MESLNAPYWRIWDSAGCKVNEYMKRSDKTPQASYSDLKEFLDTCSGDWVTIMIYTQPPNRTAEGETKPGTQAGQTKYQYRVLLGKGNNAIQAAPIAGFAAPDYEKMKMEIADSLRLEFENDRLKKENEELKKELAAIPEYPEGETWQDTLAGLIKEYLTKDKIAKTLKFEKTSAPIADKGEGLVKETVEAIEGVMQGRTPELLEALNTAAKNNPEGFKQIAEAIIQTVESEKQNVA